MTDDTTRRRVLALAGSTATVALGGCSTVLGGLEDGDGTDPVTSPRRSVDPTGTPTATTRRSNDPTRTPTTATQRPDYPTGTATTEATEAATAAWSPDEVVIQDASTSLASAPVTDTGARYGRMGTDDAETTATVFGSWKCPYTREFVLTQLPDLVERFVLTGEVAIEFRSLAYVDGEPFLGPDAPRAARAGLAVWNVDPGSFWSYLETVFQNQPQERHEWGQTELLARFASAADVASIDTVERAIETGQYRGAVDATTTAAARLGIGTVPRVAVEGEVTAPTVRPADTIAQLERATSA